MASKSVVVITGVVAAIARYHYVRILNSSVDAFSAVQLEGTGDYVVDMRGAQFYDA